MPLKCFAYHFFLHFVQWQRRFFYIFFRVLYVIIILANRGLHGVNDSRYRRLMRRHYRSSNHRSHLSYLPHLSGTFRHQVVHHLLQLRHLAHIEQNRIKNLPFALKAFTLTRSHQRGKTLRILCGKIILQDSSRDLPVGFNDRYLLGDVLQLTNVAGPRVSQ